jgi:hypothetical protein
MNIFKIACTLAVAFPLGLEQVIFTGVAVIYFLGSHTVCWFGNYYDMFGPVS